MKENENTPSSSIAAAAAAPISIENFGVGSQPNDQDEMKIFVKVTKTIPLEIKKSDTIRNVKARFRDQEGIPENLQEIFFAGNHLNNNQTLADCNIQKHSTLNMFVHSMAGMQIFVKIPSAGKSVTLDVKPWDTIQNIKAFILEKERVPPEQQVLVYAGRTLEENQTLAASNILASSTLHLVIRPTDKLKIFINTPHGKLITLNVKIWYTVEDVKVMIESLLGVPLNAHQLVHDEKILVDSCTLNDYKIGQGSTLHLTTRLMQIFVKTWEGKTITLEVQSSDNINHVMAKIEEKLGFHIRHHYLVFSGRKLKNDLSLADYNIQKGSTILLIISPTSLVRHINVSTVYHGDIKLQVELSTTISDVKEMLWEKIGIPTYQQILLYFGKEVDGERLLEDYNIRRGSTLHLAVH